MTGRIFIQVILPLRLEWEPFYYQEIELSESAGDASGLFPVTSTGSVTERDKEQVRVGDRVRVNFAGKEYVGVVSMADAGKQAEEMGIVDKVKPILGMAEGLEPVTKEDASYSAIKFSPFNILFPKEVSGKQHRKLTPNAGPS